jgi:hypothetical protein
MSKGTEAAPEAAAPEAEAIPAPDSNVELQRAAEKRAAAGGSAATRGDERGFVER